ncbi:hypothetical protein [Nocardiopsis tropica]|uniref:Uncharacterized protein n=1 Tax=Nocardiopsis tropica TaxID=109330 RepID=A0ABU7KR69_9ACTN|nr:hypothetical protein [Nocardiopsis umidischolae]MEE2051800.1 hypothetical protein [Nocardiopsis umidischolae]
MSNRTAAPSAEPKTTTPPMTEAERDLTALAEAVGVLRITTTHGEG